MKPFMNPVIEDQGSGSSMDKSIKEYNNNFLSDTHDLELALGRIPITKGGGRTLNIPKYMPENTIPGNSYNNANTIGAPCIGTHCGISILPTAHNYGPNIIPNMDSSPPGVELHMPVGNRLGNNTFNINDYQVGSGNHSNVWNTIFDPKSNKFYYINSKQGIKILNKFIEKRYI